MNSRPRPIARRAGSHAAFLTAIALAALPGCATKLDEDIVLRIGLRESEIGGYSAEAPTNSDASVVRIVLMLTTTGHCDEPQTNDSARVDIVFSNPPAFQFNTPIAIDEPGSPVSVQPLVHIVDCPLSGGDLRGTVSIDALDMSPSADAWNVRGSVDLWVTNPIGCSSTGNPGVDYEFHWSHFVTPSYDRSCR